MTTYDEPFNRHFGVDVHSDLAECKEIALSNADRDRLLSLLDNPPVPTKDLCELMRRVG